MENMTTVSELLRHVEKKYKNPKALNEFANGAWISTSTEDMLQQIREIALGLHALGIKKGQKIALLAFPNPQWSIIDMAIIVAGAISVPIFPNISDESFVFEVEQSEATTLFLGSGIPERLYPAHKELFKTVISMHVQSAEPDKLSLEKLRELGRNIDQQLPHKYEELLEGAHADDIATIIYTSGSTGVPKGAEISHRAVTSLISFQGFNWDSNADRYLSILPLAHVFGRVMNFCFLAWGISIYYLNDPNSLPIACQLAHPTILVVVPRVLEKVYIKMVEKVDQAGFFKRAIAHWAFDLANDEHDESLKKQLLHPIADKIVYSTLREAFGGSIRVIISGGAPLSPHLAHFYIDIGLQVYEGWGLTEACPITVNYPGNRKVGTVGKALPGMEIKLGPEDEILVKGPILMKGYYKNEVVAKSFDAEGWLKTGDKGAIDSEGYLTIIGRLKELLKTSTGEYVVPVPIEQALSKAPLVDMAMVVADRRKYTTCLIFPNLNLLNKLKESSGYTTLSHEDFLSTPLIREQMQKVIDQINEHLNKYEKIQDFRFIPHAPSVESGELTPSMKIRRDAVEQRYKELIDTMYPKESL